MSNLIVPLFILAFFALMLGGLWREYRRIQSLEDFTDAEKAVLIRQVNAILIFLPFLFLQMGWMIIGSGLARDNPANLYVPVFLQLIGMVILIYIAISSIRHRVTILRGRGQGKLLKGRSAVLMGYFVLVFSIVAALFLIVVPFWGDGR